MKKTLGKKAIPYDDGRHAIYVNAAVDDGSEAAKMMKYFKTADPDDLSQGDLSRRVRFLKKEQGGYQTMCEAAEKLVKWGIEEGEINNSRKLAIKMYQKGSKPEEIAELLEEC
ncbi:MAG: hypothetical protein LUI87_08420 [Lachnospiraceae bacterium]|nr:hypothetical protein [Lachnospiraceae bacterium]